jgi:type I restriction enzyme S subunit
VTLNVTVTLGEVARFVRGITFKPEDVVPVETPNSVVCLRTKNVQAELDLRDVWAVDESFVRRADQFLELGDILISSANSWNLVGKCSWIPELPWKTSFGGFVTVLRADPDKVYPRFLFWWFSSPRIQALARSFGNKTTSISNLNIDRCLALSFDLPSLNEQKRIAEVLDQAEILRIKRQTAIKKLNSFVRADFFELFGDPSKKPGRWPWKTVGDLLLSATYGTSEKAAEVGEFPVLRMGNITTAGELDLSSLKYMDVSEKERARYLVEEGDILFNRTNSPDLVGKTALFRELRKMAYAGYLIRLRVNVENDPEYVAAFLNSSYVKKTLRSMCKSIVGMANINAKELQSIKIPQPPLELQREFARHVGQIEKLKAVHRRHLSKLDVLFASLQHRAFRGEL